MNFLRIPVCCRRHLAHLYRFRTPQKQAASDIQAVPVISAFHISAGSEPATVSYGVLCWKILTGLLGRRDWIITLSISLYNYSSLSYTCQSTRLFILNTL